MSSVTPDFRVQNLKGDCLGGDIGRSHSWEQVHNPAVSPLARLVSGHPSGSSLRPCTHVLGGCWRPVRAMRPYHEEPPTPVRFKLSVPCPEVTSLKTTPCSTVLSHESQRPARLPPTLLTDLSSHSFLFKSICMGFLYSLSLTHRHPISGVPPGAICDQQNAVLSGLR